MRIATRLLLMFAGAVGVVLIIGCTSYFSLSHLIADNRLFSHSQRVLQELNLLLYNLSDTVCTQRVYMITGQEIYLDAYKGLISATNESLEKIRLLVSDNAAQSYKVEKLSALVKERLASLEVTTQTYQQKGLESAFYRVRTGNSLRFRVSLHNAIDEIKASEMALLQKREAELKRSVASTQLTIVAGTGLGFILLSLFSFLFGRYILNHLSQILHAVDNLKYKRFDLTMPTNTDDEFGELAAAFNVVSHQLLTLANGLEKKEKELQELKEELQSSGTSDNNKASYNALVERFDEVIQSYNEQTGDTKKTLEDLPVAMESILKSWQTMLNRR